MRPRVFVSSVVKGFEQYREATRKGIEDAGAEPVLVNEDFPALATSSRNACLDGVDSCDIYIVIVGERGGWPAPSGKLVVEEEYEQARKGKKRILAFIQDVKRDEDAQRVVNHLSDYVDGFFRPTFKTAEELRSLVAQALAKIIPNYSNPQIEVTMIQEKLSERFQIPNESRLRFVLTPERNEEVIDVVKLEAEDFKRLLYDIGHARDVGLLSYEHPKTTSVGISSIVVIQADSSGRRFNDKVVQLEISSNGAITIDTNVTGRINRGSLHGLAEGFAIVEADVIECLQSSFAFANSFYGQQDPYKRHSRFFYNAALGEIGYRKLVTEINERGGMTFGNSEGKIVPAFDKPRVISQEDLSNPSAEISAVMAMFRRRLKE